MPSFHAPGTRKGNVSWIGRGSIDGRRYEVALPEATSRRSAERCWARFAAEVRSGAAAEARERAPKPVLTLADAIAQYEAADERSGAQAAFLEPIKADEIARILLADLTIADIHKAAHRLYPGRKASTKNRNCVSVIGAVVHYAHACGWMHWLAIKRFKEDKPPPRRPPGLRIPDHR